jgi:hypothetical protein
MPHTMLKLSKRRRNLSESRCLPLGVLAQQSIHAWVATTLSRNFVDRTGKALSGVAKRRQVPLDFVNGVFELPQLEQRFAPSELQPRDNVTHCLQFRTHSFAPRYSLKPKADARTGKRPSAARAPTQGTARGVHTDLGRQPELDAWQRQSLPQLFPHSVRQGRMAHGAAATLGPLPPAYACAHPARGSTQVDVEFGMVNAAATAEPSGSTPSLALQKLQSGEIGLDEYLDDRAELAIAHLKGTMPEEQLGVVRDLIRERLRSDPVTVELVRQATHLEPQPGTSA